MAVCRNRPNEFGRDHRNVRDSGQDSEELADNTIILADTIFVTQWDSEGNYEERARELEEKVLKLTQQVQDLQSSNDQLTHATIEYQGLIDKLSKEIEQLRSANSEKHEVIRSLQAKVNELQTQVNELRVYECDRDKLYLCQVAVEFERAICSHVLPEVFSTSGNAKIEALLNMLNSGDEGYVPLDPAKYDIKTILSEARKRWEKICGDLKLPPEWKKRTGEKKIKFYHRSDPDIFRAIALLKHARNFVAHPNPVTVQVAEETVKTDSIKSDLKEWEFKLVQDFILSLRANIRKSGIKTDQDRLKIE